MGMFKWTSYLVLVSLYPLFTFEVSATTSTQLMSDQIKDDLINVCALVYCGKGTCHPTSIGLGLPFTCDCDSGWKKPNFGTFELPPCVLPNCTIDLTCGNNGSLPSAPPPNVSNPCLLNLCGDGTCERLQGSDFRCQCNEGSANLLNDPKLLCLKKCNFGADCNGFDLGFGTPPPPPPPTSGTGTAGSGEAQSSTRELHMLATTILALIFQMWIN